jgi:CubicO group peptidase (beta-lactamase class C family)
MRKITILLLLFVANICFAQQTVHFADSIRKTYDIPELSYAVVDGKTILEISVMGRHSVDLRDTATIDDRFHIGSNTKAMTAFVIAKFVEKGKLEWTTKFFDLFPEWRVSSALEYDKITLQDLLSHRAGIQPFQGENDPVIPEIKGSKQERRKAFGRFVLTLEPVEIDSVHPFIYSNAGYTLATLMLEKVTHKSWEQLVEKVFNKDLKLNVQFSWPENQQAKDTWGHSFENDRWVPVPSNTGDQLDFTEPAGDLNLKLKDYAKFIQLNLQGLQGQDNYLTAKTYQFIHKGIDNYALGWFNVYENGKELSTHAGTVGTYYTLVQIDRLKGLGYIIFSNSFNQATQQGVRLLMRKLKGNYGSEG